ncbi:hypothetical protein HOD29_04230 [archaeon]|jgi:hypothetical protein|nr:hypothetical protein [archaeon]
MGSTKLLVFCLAFFLLAGSASAYVTIIDIKSLPHHTVFVTPIELGSGFSALAQPMQGFTNKYGDVRFEADIERQYFNLYVIVKDGDEKVYYEKVKGEFISGSLVEAVVLPESVAPIATPEVEAYVLSPEVVVVNDTEDPEEENVTEETVVGEKKLRKMMINGYSVVEENKPMFNTIYYSIIGVTGLLIVFFTVRKNNKKLFKIEKKKGNIHDLEEDEDLRRAEIQLERAQKKVDNLKNDRNRKIKEVKAKLRKDQEELMRLKRLGEKKEEKREEKKEERKVEEKKDLDNDDKDKKE